MSGACGHSPPPSGADLGRVRRWWILIGASPVLEGVDWHQAARDTQLVVLGGDPAAPAQSNFPRETMRLGYLSVGEADPRRPYWNEVRGAPFLVEPDPSWPENVRVDVRDRNWQELLLTREIPRLLDQGFDGLMLDTIDTAPYLEAKDPARFAGSRQALRDFRGADPGPVPPRAADRQRHLRAGGRGAVRGRLRDRGGLRDLRLRPTSLPRDDERGTRLEAGPDRRRGGGGASHPVFTIDYADVGDFALARWAESAATEHGFKPYVGRPGSEHAPLRGSGAVSGFPCKFQLFLNI